MNKALTKKIGAAFVAFVLALAGLFIPAAANAATVSPVISNMQFTDLENNIITKVQEGQPFKYTFDFGLPNGANPGDTFLVPLPAGVKPYSPGQTVELSDGAATAVITDDGVLVTLNDKIAGLASLMGQFEYAVTYSQQQPIGENETVNVGFTMDSEYQEIEVGPGPPPAQLTINKWSGYSNAPTQRTTFKLDPWYTPYGGQWVQAVEGQTLAHWFVEINYPSSGTPISLGDNVVLTDSMQPIPGYTPQLEKNDPVVNDRDISSDLNGYYLVPSLVVRADDVNGNLTAFGTTTGHGPNNVQLTDYIDFSGTPAEGMSFTVRVSDFFEAIGFQNKDDGRLSIDYFTVIPEKSANITNIASVESTTVTTPATDGGWYKHVDASGWIRGDQPLTALTVNKVWEGIASNNPAVPVTLSLLADGQPATDLNGIVLADQTITLQPGNTSYTWENLPTQSAPNVAITYTVVEAEGEGFTQTGGQDAQFIPEFTPEKLVDAKAPAGEITLTNELDPVEPPTPTEPPVDPPTPTEPPVDPPTPTVPPVTPPTPEIPQQPEVPAKPTPNVPTQPTPKVPAKPEVPAKKVVKTLPRTGSEALAPALAAMVLLAIGGGLIWSRKRG